MTDTESLHRIAEYLTQSHGRTNHLHFVHDHLLHACSRHGLSVDELHGLLSAIHACVAPNQGIDDEMATLLNVCIQIEIKQGSAS